jgi:hypothetical protein
MSDTPRYTWDEDEMQWHDVMDRPITDEQKYGSSDRPPKHWLEMTKGNADGDIFGTTMNIRPRYGLE